VNGGTGESQEVGRGGRRTSRRVAGHGPDTGKGASAASTITGGVEPNGGHAMEVGLGGFYVVRPVRPLATQTATVSSNKFGTGLEAMLFMLVYL
jgi:hypothetical protein